jgi:hypothetical protein
MEKYLLKVAGWLGLLGGIFEVVIVFGLMYGPNGRAPEQVITAERWQTFFCFAFGLVALYMSKMIELGENKSKD